MKRWCVPAVFAALLFVACGDDAAVPSDEGSGADAGEAKGPADGGLDGEADDTDASCGRTETGGTIDSNGCTSTQSYSCGASAYEIACTCPASTCTCTKNGAVVGTATWNGCSGGSGSCAISFGGVAEQCGIPSGGSGPAAPPPPDDQ